MAAIKGRYRGPRPPQFPVNPKWNRAKNEVIIARVPTDVQESEMQYRSSFSIVFGDIKFVDGKEVVENEP